MKITDLYCQVTDQIIADLERGTPVWLRPWKSGNPQTLSPRGDTVKLALVHLDASDQIERVVDAIRATRSDTADEIAEMEQDAQ
jgi:hypothetical protein